MAEVAAAGDPKPQPENSEQIKKEFAENKQDVTEKPPETHKVESEQVKNAQHGLQGGPKPPGSTRAAVDSQSHNRAMSQDDKNAEAARREQAKKAAANARAHKEKFTAASQEQQKSQGQDKDMGR